MVIVIPFLAMRLQLLLDVGCGHGSSQSFESLPCTILISSVDCSHPDYGISVA